jgi:hypothetical protein
MAAFDDWKKSKSHQPPLQEVRHQRRELRTGVLMTGTEPRETDGVKMEIAAIDP